MPKVIGQTIEEIMYNRQRRTVQVHINIDPSNDAVSATMTFFNRESLDALGDPDFGPKIRQAVDGALAQYDQVKAQGSQDIGMPPVGVTGGALVTSDPDVKVQLIEECN